MSGQNLKISGDAPGVVAAYLEEQLGGTVLYINGAAGNIAPIYSVYAERQRPPVPVPGAARRSRYCRRAGDGRRNRRVVIRHGEQVVETPREPELDWPDELAAYATSDRQRIKLAPAVRRDQRHLDLVGSGRDVL